MLAGLTAVRSLGVALALAANPYLDHGRQLFKGVRFEEALEQLQLARQVSSSTPAERREVLDLLGRTYLAVGKEKEAAQAFSDLLVDDPHAVLSGSPSPKVRATFLKAKEALYPKPFVRLDVIKDARGPTAVAVLDPWGEVAKVELKLKSGDGAFGTRVLPVDAGRASLDTELSEGLVGYAQAVSQEGQVLASAGSADAPWSLSPATLTPSASGSDGPVVSLAARAEPAAPAWPKVTLLAAGAVVAAAGAGVVYWGFADARAAEAAAIAADVPALNESARGKAIAGYSLLGVGGAMVVSGLIWWLLQ